jgi:hypothetical protein
MGGTGLVGRPPLAVLCRPITRLSEEPAPWLAARTTTAQEAAVQERWMFEAEPRRRRRLEPLLAVGSAIAWGALAVSLWGFIERSRARRIRHKVSNRLLSQVFPAGCRD